MNHLPRASSHWSQREHPVPVTPRRDCRLRPAVGVGILNWVGPCCPATACLCLTVGAWSGVRHV